DADRRRLRLSAGPQRGAARPGRGTGARVNTMNKKEWWDGKRIGSLCLLVCTLAGCANIDQYAPAPIKVATRYDRPAAPEQTLAEPAQQAVRASGRWWQAFDDPRLDRLVTKVLANNNNL